MTAYDLCDNLPSSVHFSVGRKEHRALHPPPVSGTNLARGLPNATTSSPPPVPGLDMVQRGQAGGEEAAGVARKEGKVTKRTTEVYIYV